MKFLKFTIFCCVVASTVINAYGQDTIIIAENTFKIKGKSDQLYYYGLAEGDKLLFSFETLNNETLQEVEIAEYTGGSKFTDYKTKKINTNLFVAKTGVYVFRFLNSHLTSRVCKFQVRRISKAENSNFNTTVYWRNTNDSIYKLVDGKYLASSDTAIVNLTETTAKVHSSGNIHGHTSEVTFTLPANTVSWSYYIGVNQAGQKAYEDATEELTKRAGPVLATLPGYGPLAALALGGISYLSKLQGGEDIDFQIVTGENIDLLKTKQPYASLKTGKVINDFSRMETKSDLSFLVFLSNDNAVTGVTVLVKVTAVTITQTYKSGSIKKYKIHTKQEPYLKN